MAGSKLNTYSSSYTSLTNYATCIDAQRAEYSAIMLTNYSTTARPAIAAGSQAECAGALYRFSTEEAISTASILSTSNATWFINLVPSSSEMTAEFSTVVPSWRTDYCGWYYSTSSNNRVVGECIFNSSYYHKYIFSDADRCEFAIKRAFYIIPPWNMDSTSGGTGGLGNTMDHSVTSTRIVGAESWIVTAASSLARYAGFSVSQFGVLSTYVSWLRLAGDAFDNTNFDSTSVNRGYVYIFYQ